MTENYMGAFRSALRNYFFSYFDSWSKYGLLFAVLITGSLLLQAQEFLQANGTNPYIYTAIVLTFLVASTGLSVFKLDKVAFRYNPADRVSWYLGTKEAPPWYYPIARIVVAAWFLSFLGIIYLDSLVTFSRLARWELSLPTIALNLTLIAQFVIPVFMKMEKGKN